MSLSIVPWQRPDTDWITSAVQHAAQLQQQRESMAQQLAQDAARQRQHEEQLDFNRKQEARIASAQQFKQQLNQVDAAFKAQNAAARLRQSGDLNTARISELGRRHTGTAGVDFPDLPMPSGGGPLDGAETSAPVESPVSPSQQLTSLTALANQGDNSALSDQPISLRVQNPFANSTDFAGVEPDDRAIIQTDGAEGLLAPQDLAPPASMAEQLASMGGADRPLAVASPNDMPAGPAIGEAPDSNPLLPAIQPDQGGLQRMSDMLGADAVARVNGAKAAGGAKLAAATLKAELSQVRKPVNPSAVAEQDPDYKAIAGWDTHGAYKINPDDPSQIFLRSFSANGKPSYQAVKPDIMHIGGEAFLKDIDGNLTKIAGGGTVKLPTPRDYGLYKEAVQLAETTSADLATKTESAAKRRTFGIFDSNQSDVDAAKRAADAAQRDLQYWSAKYPSLGKKEEPAKLDAAPAESTPDGFKSAFASAKSGDIVTYNGKKYRKP